jgi:MFS family permease
MAILKQFSGTNAVTVYAGNVAETIVSGQLLLLVPSIVNFAAFVGGFSSGFVLSYLGRKTGGQIGTFIEAISNILAGIAVYIASEARTTEITLLIIGLFVNRMAYGAFIGPVTWLYMPEIVEPWLSPFTTAMNWFTGSLVVILFPILAALGNPGPIFIFFAAYCFLSFLFNQFFMVETKGKTQLEIKQKYKELSCC